MDINTSSIPNYNSNWAGLYPNNTYPSFYNNKFTQEKVDLALKLFKEDKITKEEFKILLDL